MIFIKDLDSLKEALMTDNKSGRFIKPIKEFIKEGILLEVDNRKCYRLNLDDNADEMIEFQIKSDQISFKSYQKKIKGRYNYHRDNDLPANITYNDNGDAYYFQWFINGYARRDHIMKPIKIENKNGIWQFFYKYDISETCLFAVDYIHYNQSIKENKVIKVGIEYKYSYFEHNLIKARTIIPEIDKLTFEDCFDLSKNIFTADYITLLEMETI